jgi:hypothetical protein
MPRTFVDDDLGYEEWLRTHTAGYVINCERRPRAGYLMLHLASCHTIRGIPDRGDTWTTADYMKVCADTIDALEAWTVAETGGQPQRCGSCAP